MGEKVDEKAIKGPCDASCASENPVIVAKAFLRLISGHTVPYHPWTSQAWKFQYFQSVEHEPNKCFGSVRLESFAKMRGSMVRLLF